MVKEGMVNEVMECARESWSTGGAGTGATFVCVVTNGAGKGRTGCADDGLGGSSRRLK